METKILKLVDKSDNAKLWSIEDMLQDALKDVSEYTQGIVILTNSDGEVLTLLANLNRLEVIGLLRMASIGQEQVMK